MKKMYIASESVPGGRRASIQGVTTSPSEVAASSFNMNQVDRFEEKKVSDLKRLFLEFTKINLIFHSKSVEMFTRCYKDILDIDEKADITEFRYTFKISSDDKITSSSLLTAKKNPTVVRNQVDDEDEDEEQGKYSKRHDRSNDEERQIV